LLNVSVVFFSYWSVFLILYVSRLLSSVMRAAVQSSSNFFHNVELLRSVYCSGRVPGNHDERRADGWNGRMIAFA
jgi:hypothetical protein